MRAGELLSGHDDEVMIRRGVRQSTSVRDVGSRELGRFFELRGHYPRERFMIRITSFL
jgi:hypothetical protein